MQWKIGCSGFQYRWWYGRFYPLGSSRWKNLDYYSTKLGIVEVNATFYRQFQHKTAYDWQKRTSENFKFILKVPKSVSHEKQMSVEDLGAFKMLARHLGYYFEGAILQLPPSQEYDLQFLKDRVEALGISPLFVEFRDNQWIWKLDSLMELGIIPVHPFWHDYRYTIPLASTKNQKTLYLRFHGTEGFAKGAYSKEFFSNLIREVQEYDYSRVYAFFNNDYQAQAPFNAMMLQDLVREIT